MSEKERASINGGGSSLKYTFVSVLSFNIIIKILMYRIFLNSFRKSSMNYLWSLVHALQVFNFLLYMNIEFPANLRLFGNYLEIASGEIEELQQFVPDILSHIFDYDEIEEDWDVLQDSFRECGIDTPYIMISFSKGMTLMVLVFGVTLPFFMLLNKLCKK